VKGGGAAIKIQIVTRLGAAASALVASLSACLFVRLRRTGTPRNARLPRSIPTGAGEGEGLAVRQVGAASVFLYHNRGM
jgi:hypothetical protein